MKTKLTYLMLATLLLSGCNYTKIKTAENGCAGWRALGESEFRTLHVEYTNTSSSKYIEVTIKYTYKSGRVETYTKKLKPGEIETDCLYPKTQVSVVGEREIND
jgi:hypothetical protein